MPKSKALDGLSVAIVNRTSTVPHRAVQERKVTLRGISVGVDVGARTERSRHRHALSVASVCILSDSTRMP